MDRGIDGSQALVRFSKPRACGAKWYSDGVTAHLCWSAHPQLKCANAGPDLPSTQRTRFDGVVKQRKDMIDRRDFAFRRI